MAEGPLSGMFLILAIIVVNYFLNFSRITFEFLNINNIKKNTNKNEKSNQRIVKMFDSNSRLSYTFDIIFLLLNIEIGIILYSQIIVNFIKLSKVITNQILFYILCCLLLIAILLLVVIFGIILPKKHATRDADHMVYKINNIVYILFIFFKPLTWLMEQIMKLLYKLAGINPEELEENVTEEEIISMVHEGKEQGVFQESEVEMISNIIELNEKEAQDIMTHKKKAVMISIEENIKDALKFMLEEGFSRYPLYEDTKDNVIGILHLKDVIHCYISEDDKDVSLKDIAREAFFVPDTQNISVLFHEMQSRNIHMAIAIDEYGQTAGIVAMEDILEEIVGNIWDEYDTKEKLIINRGDNVFIVLGAIHLDELNRELDINLENEDYDTLNGLLISLLDRIPQDGEKATVDYNGYRFNILSTGNRMIEKVKISKLEVEDKE